jgi:hypothetical protein
VEPGEVLHEPRQLLHASREAFEALLQLQASAFKPFDHLSERPCLLLLPQII